MSAPPSAPEPRLIARSMVSLVMFADSALSIAARRRGLPAGSATPARVATVISRISLVNTLARLASSAFLRPSMDGPLPIQCLHLVQLNEPGILPDFGRRAGRPPQRSP